MSTAEVLIRQRARCEDVINEWLESQEGLLKSDLNNSQVYKVYDTLFKLYNYNNSKGFTHSSNQRFLKRYLNNLTSPCGIEIALLFRKEGALTLREVQERTGISYQTTSNIFKALTDSGLIRHVAFVESPYRKVGGGPRPKIYALYETSEEKIVDAQRRYAEYCNKALAAELERQKADMNRKITRQTAIDEYATKVFMCVQPKYEGLRREDFKMRFIYDCADEIGVPIEMNRDVVRKVQDLVLELHT